MQELPYISGTGEIFISPGIKYLPSFKRVNLAPFDGRITYLYADSLRSATTNEDIAEFPTTNSAHTTLPIYPDCLVSIEYAERSKDGTHLLLGYQLSPLNGTAHLSNRLPPLDCYWIGIGPDVENIYSLWSSSIDHGIAIFDSNGERLLLVHPDESDPMRTFPYSLSILDITQDPPHRQLIDQFGEYSFLFPTWSTDGTKVYFEHLLTTDHPQGIYVLDLVTREVTPIICNGEENSFPRCSPDGKYLAYITKGQINIYDFSTSIICNPAPSLKLHDGPPCWSPNGAVLAVTANIASASYETDLFTIRQSDGEINRITNSGYCHSPSWSIRA